MSDIKKRGVPRRPVQDDGRTKVLLSVSDDDLKLIDNHADAAGMSRSAYLVAMGKHGSASIFDAIDRLRAELANTQDRLERFEHNTAAWHAEADRLKAQIAEANRRFEDLERAGLDFMRILHSNDVELDLRLHQREPFERFMRALGFVPQRPPSID